MLCLEHLGVAARAVRTGSVAGVAFETGRVQADLARLADQACLHHWVIDGGMRSPLDEGLESRYLRYLVAHECLVGGGYPTAEPPSLERFVDQGGTVWHPYAASPTGGPTLVVDDCDLPPDVALAVEMQEACPVPDP